MDNFTLGDYVIMELALAAYFKEVDVSMYAGQQIQKMIGKVEVNIARLEEAAKDQGTIELNPKDPAGPQA